MSAGNGAHTLSAQFSGRMETIGEERLKEANERIERLSVALYRRWAEVS